ncbi:hypothetical protein F5887DRAFT_1284641 [Amanita rubescens]|nr:hypothetical protein F5887DRAFT_1284641 [Amanita rubescens]
MISLRWRPSSKRPYTMSLFIGSLPRGGPFHPNYVDASSHSPILECREALMKLSPQLMWENMAKHTPKDSSPVCKGDELGEAGNYYVEVQSQGGIISFDDGIANIQTEAKAQYTLKRSYLLKFHEGESIQFVPPCHSAPQGPTQASPQRQKAGTTFFPHTDSDACYHPMPQSLVGLGLTGINPRPGCAWRQSVRKMTEEILSGKMGDLWRK